MNGWQLMRQIKDTLEAVTWDDDSTLVLQEVAVTSGDGAFGRLAALRTPFALVRPAGWTADGEQENLRRQQVEVIVVTAVMGDERGERALIGGPRSAGQNASQGRGVLEIEERVDLALDTLRGEQGVRVYARSASAAATQLVEGLGWVAARSLRLDAEVGVARDYPAAYAFIATGQVQLTWRNPGSRYDLRRVVLRRALGNTAPASPDAGTGVTLSGDLATSVSDAPSPGTYSYALFVAYDETGSSTDERWSDAVVVEGVSVV